MDELRQRLLTQAFLYDNPEAYVAGVEAALRAVQQLPQDATDATTRPAVRHRAG